MNSIHYSVDFCVQYNIFLFCKYDSTRSRQTQYEPIFNEEINLIDGSPYMIHVSSLYVGLQPILCYFGMPFYLPDRSGITRFCFYVEQCYENRWPTIRYIHKNVRNVSYCAPCLPYATHVQQTVMVTAIFGFVYNICVYSIFIYCYY